MKFCLVILTIAFVAAVAADDEWSPPSDSVSMRQMHTKCLEESGATGEQVEKIRKYQLSDDKEVHAFVHCNVKTFGIFTDDAGYNADRMVRSFTELQLDEEKSRAIVTKCVDSNEQKSTPIEWAYRGMECLINNKIEDLFKEAQDKLKNNNDSENKV